MKSRAKIIFTCEHASKNVPRELRYLFSKNPKALASHRGWDEGAQAAARIFSTNLRCPLISGEHSRLLIDLNRSRSHPSIFSEFTKHEPLPLQDHLTSTLYTPFRKKTLALIAKIHRSEHPVHHFSIHSFTPVLNGVARNCDIGILFHHQRPRERQLAILLRQSLQNEFPKLRIRMNYPYRGSSDGHTTHLRSTLPPNSYVGIEIEFNQAWLKSLERKRGEKLKSLRLFSECIKQANLSLQKKR